MSYDSFSAKLIDMEGEEVRVMIWKKSGAILLVLGLLACLPAPAGAQPSGSTQAPSLRIQLEINPLVECHFYLKTHGKQSIRPDPSAGVDLDPEIALYANAQRTIVNDEVWRWFETLIAEGPDAAAVAKAAAKLPPALNDERSQVGAKMITDAFISAYPKFEKAVWLTHQRSLNRAVIGARKRFRTADERIAKVLMEKMGFGRIDKPVTVYVVVRTGGASAWGKTSSGYFTVIGMAGVAPLTLLESSVHEATHIVDTLQSFGHKWVLQGVRDGLKGSDLAQVDIFVHGLITYNAGALVKRFISPAYQPAGVHAPGHAEEYRPYLSTYEVIWNQYLDGKYTREAIVPKLIEEFKAVQALKAQSGLSS